MHMAGSGLSAVCIIVQTFTFLVDSIGLHISRGCLGSVGRPREGQFKCWR